MTTVQYTPYGAARDLFSNREAEVAICGPAGTGKSLAALFRVHLACLRNPGIRCLIVRKVGVSLGSTTLVTFESRVAEQALDVGIMNWYGGSTREAASYRYSNGSVIVVGGLDNPDKIMSSDYDLIFVDEGTEIALVDWEKLGTRLRNNRLSWQQRILACNPSSDKHWIKQRVDRGALTMLISRHQDNPTYYNRDGSLTTLGASYMAILDSLTGVTRLRLRDGIWAAAEGVIYEEWDDAVHLIDPFDIPQEWTRYWAVDFGYTHPFVLQMWAQDPDDRLFMYREIYRTQRLVEDHAAEALRSVRGAGGRWLEPRPRAIVCDHDAEGRATLSQHLGMSTVAADKRVKIGIQSVKSRLMKAKDGRPRLFVVRNSPVGGFDSTLQEALRPAQTCAEVGAYVWAKDATGRKEEPVKVGDDGMDTMRYMVQHLERGAIVPRIRVMGAG